MTTLRGAILAAQRLAGLGTSEPVRLELAAAVAWLATGAWSAEALAADMAAAADEGQARSLVVKRSAHRLFMLVEGHADVRVDPAHRFALDEIPADTFWRALRHAGGSEGSENDGLYVTGDPAALCPRAAASLVCSASPDGAAGVLSLAADEPAHPPSLWLSSEGCVTVCHYDMSANVLVQMLGEKTVELWPPLSAAALHVYPDSHPRARKSQADVRALASGLSPAGAADVAGALPPPAHTVLLRPGQALYIPPFYFHRVSVSRAPEGSASLNCFSPCALSRAAQHLLAPFAPSALPPLPVEPRWDRQALLLPALAHLLLRVHGALHGALLRTAREAGACAPAGLPALGDLLAQLLSSRYDFGCAPHSAPKPAGEGTPAGKEAAGGAAGRGDVGASADELLRLKRAKRRRTETAALLPPPAAAPSVDELCAQLDAFLLLRCADRPSRTARGAHGAQPCAAAGAFDLAEACDALAWHALRPHEALPTERPAAARPGAAAGAAGEQAAAAQEGAYQRGVLELVLCHVIESVVVTVLGRGAGGARDGDGLRDLLRAVRAAEAAGAGSGSSALAAPAG